MILLHGMGSSLHNWDYLVPDLVSAGFSTYALDLLGHGDSPKPEEPGRYQIEAVYDWLENWLLGLELKKSPTLVGHSMGAYLALEYALRHGEKIARLVLIDPFYSKKQASLFLRLATRRPEVSVKVLEAAPEWVVVPIVKLDRNVTAHLHPDMVHQIASDYKRLDPKIMHATPSADITPSLDQIQNETLVIWGEKDLTLNAKSFPMLVEQLPNCEGRPIRKAGHTPHLTERERVNRLILDFLGT